MWERGQVGMDGACANGNGGYPNNAPRAAEAPAAPLTQSSGRIHHSAALQRSSSQGRCRTRHLPAEMEQMVAAMDQRVSQAIQAEDARIRMVTDKAQELGECLQAMKVAGEIYEERRQKELHILENNVQVDLSNTAQARKDFEARMEELGHARVEEHRRELIQAQGDYQTVREGYERAISEEVKRLQGLLEEQRVSRVDKGERINQTLEAEFQQVQQAVAEEEKLRNETENNMVRMVEDVCARVRSDIMHERQEREAVQGRLLGLLEETCARLEMSFAIPEKLSHVIIS